MLELKNRRFYLDGNPFILYSGEIHYFRIKPENWKKVLQRAREANLNSISTYIPWCWHEESDGKFDFSGRTHPQKNLIKFIETAKKLNLYINMRIGPVSNAELKNEGIPEWLLKKHPEILTKASGIENLPHVTLLSYLNPAFLKYVSRWHSRVLPVIQRFQEKILLIQLDNEIGMSHWVNRMPDLSAMAKKMYQNFLKKKYASISKLNASYKTAYASFSAIGQPYRSTEFPVLFDWALFYRTYFAQYCINLKKSLKGKTSSPVLINIPQFYDYDTRGRGFFSPTTTSMFRDFPKENLTMGGAYQLRRIDYENFHDIFITSETVNMINRSNPNICAELQTGIMRDRPKIYPLEAEYHIKTTLASGLKGLNCYMFAGGENPAGLGLFGKYHDWQAPVGKDGKERFHYEPIKNTGLFLKTFGRSLGDTEKANDTAFGYYLPYYATEFADFSQLENIRNRYFFDGMGRLLILGNTHFKMTDILKEDISKEKSLWVMSWKWMDPETQKKLWNYAETGGNLAIGPWLPYYFLKKLGLKRYSVPGEKIILVGGDEIFVEADLEFYKNAGGKILATDRSGKNTAAFYKKIGKGALLVHGFPFVHYFDFQIDIIQQWAGLMGIKNSVKVFPKEVISVLHKGKNGNFLFVLNYHNLPLNAEIKTAGKLLCVPMAPQQIKILPLGLRSGDWEIDYSTSEILSLDAGKFLISGKSGEKGEIKGRYKEKNIDIKFTLRKDTEWIKI